MLSGVQLKAAPSHLLAPASLLSVLEHSAPIMGGRARQSPSLHPLGSLASFCLGASPFLQALSCGLLVTGRQERAAPARAERVALSLGNQKAAAHSGPLPESALPGKRLARSGSHTPAGCAPGQRLPATSATSSEVQEPTGPAGAMCPWRPRAPHQTLPCALESVLAVLTRDRH